MNEPSEQVIILFLPEDLYSEEEIEQMDFLEVGPDLKFKSMRRLSRQEVEITLSSDPE